MTSLSPATIFTMDIYKRLYRPDADERDLKRMIRICIIVLGVLAMAVAAYLPPILAAMNWLFSWLVPIFWVVVFGLVWKRNAIIAVVTLVAAWLANTLWSFTDLPEMMGMADVISPYITLAVTLIMGVSLNLFMKGEPGYFKSDHYRTRHITGS
jgi:SSS family solute:Na+ symporter